YDRQVDRFTGFYRFSRYAHGSLEKMGVLMSMSGADLRLRKNDEGMLLMFDHRGKERRLIQVEPLLFRSIDDSYYMAFRQDERGRITHLFTDGTSALEKIGWTATLQVNRAFFAFAQTIFFLIVISYLWRRLRHKPYQGDHPALGKWQDRSRALMSAAFLLYPLTFAGVTALMVPEHELMVGFAYGVPKALYIVQSLPLFGIIFLLIFTACTLLGRRKQSGSFARFLWAIVVMTTGFAFVCWLHYWNLLGWRF
ncbi:hypothetical protein JXO59_09410, partial [candidate division KSB1 bacterium]|nr:hypothetical protein [candidate division KSB1 bacterium]